MSRRGGLGLCTLLLSGCVNGGAPPAYPLFGDERLPSEGAATLIGDVESVDGKSVSEHGHRFSLASGCHTVTNLTTWGGSDPSAAVMAHLPQIPFAIEMKPGLTYVLRIGSVGSAGHGGSLEITAVEQAADGSVLRRFEQGSSCP
jgi:hypothetical protein